MFEAGQVFEVLSCDDVSFSVRCQHSHRAMLGFRVVDGTEERESFSDTCHSVLTEMTLE